MEDNAVLTAELAYFGDRLKYSSLIVSGHDRDQDRGISHRIAKVVYVKHSIFLHREIGYLVPVFFQPLARIEHRLMFGQRSDDVIAFAAMGFCYTLNRQV